MVKKAVLAVVLAALASVAHAQNPGKPRLGLKAGATLARLTGNELDMLAGPNYRVQLGDRHTGFNVSLAATIPLSSTGLFTVAPELQLNHKGYKLTQTSLNTKELGESETLRINTVDRTLSYLDLPVPVRVNTNGGVYIELGPQVGYLMGSSTDTETYSKFSDSRKEATTKASSDASADVAKWEYGALAGIGYQSRNGLTIGLRYNRGFQSVLDTDAIESKPKSYNDAVILQLGYLLQLGK
jgi:hypothetical protein